ncbi:MAG: lamin tail domain-containing protein, partial [Verrucomicrobiales bacterium]|nr:lamin tail domain-containing protein [Verrucomicrobiales bacterium]
GRTITSVAYDDEAGWPVEADGGGRSLEVIDPNGDPNDPANWRASAQPGGSPGAANPVSAPAIVRLNEVFAGARSQAEGPGPWPDFIELHNPGATLVNLSKWSLSTSRNNAAFVFPSGTVLAPHGLLVVWCDGPTNAAGLHADFRLNLDGETVLLRDSAGNRIDAVTLGLQAPAFSLGRAGADAAWQLTEPTPGSVNDVARLGAVTDLAINEFLANSLAGQADWIELHNLNPTLPVALQGLFLGTSNALFQIRSHSFIAPRGFVRLFADELAGPDHLDFKLPAQGGMIFLADATGQEFSRVTYTAQREGVSMGRLPDGTGALTSFPNAASPGAPNFLAAYTGPVVNEVMARNLSAVNDPAGGFADWIELKNPASTAFDLSGMSLSVDTQAPRQWVFPPGTLLPGNGHLVVWCDEERPASATFAPVLNTGRSLKNHSGGVYLFTREGQLADFIEYGFQLEDHSIGRSGGGWTLLARPTPGAANAEPASLGSPTNLRLNEWLASGAGTDWVELYNLDSLPVHLGGLVLTDDPSLYGQTNALIAPLSYIAGRGWVKFVADGDLTRGRDHLRFRLDRLGETLRLLSPPVSILDSVDLGVQERGVAQGRFPDGAAEIVNFPTTPSPGAANYLPTPGVVINEVLSHTDAPLEDAIELFNTSAEPVDLSGWFLSNTQRDFRKYRIPDGTILPPRGYRVCYEFEFNPQPG